MTGLLNWLECSGHLTCWGRLPEFSSLISLRVYAMFWLIHFDWTTIFYFLASHMECLCLWIDLEYKVRYHLQCYRPQLQVFFAILSSEGIFALQSRSWYADILSLSTSQRVCYSTFSSLPRSSCSCYSTLWGQ